MIQRDLDRVPSGKVRDIGYLRYARLRLARVERQHPRGDVGRHRHRSCDNGRLRVLGGGGESNGELAPDCCVVGRSGERGAAQADARDGCVETRGGYRVRVAQRIPDRRRLDPGWPIIARPKMNRRRFLGNDSAPLDDRHGILSTVSCPARNTLDPNTACIGKALLLMPSSDANKTPCLTF